MTEALAERAPTTEMEEHLGGERAEEAPEGAGIEWTSPITPGLGGITVIFGWLFIRTEMSIANPFVNFNLFRNSTYTGAAISNFLLNGAAGILIVSMLLFQLGGDLSAQKAGLLTLGYAISILVFIRVGEKLLQRFGPRQSMIWGCLIMCVAIAMLMPTQPMLDAQRPLAVVAFTLFGVGLGFYAAPSTDAALSNLPEDQSGAGAGIYKMASSLGASFGVAISAAIFTALSVGENVLWLEGFINFVGRQDNVVIRQAALIALLFNPMLVAAAIMSIMLTVPKGTRKQSRA